MRALRGDSRTETRRRQGLLDAVTNDYRSQARPLPATLPISLPASRDLDEFGARRACTINRSARQEAQDVESALGILGGGNRGNSYRAYFRLASACAPDSDFHGADGDCSAYPRAAGQGEP